MVARMVATAELECPAALGMQAALQETRAQVVRTAAVEDTGGIRIVADRSTYRPFAEVALYR